MIVSRNRTGNCGIFSSPSRKRNWLVFGIAFFFFWSDAVRAQTPTEETVQILPGEAFDSATSPAPPGGISGPAGFERGKSAPGKPDPVEVGAEEFITGVNGVTEPTVSTGELAAIDTAAVGTLDPADGGFPPSMWRGTPRARVEKLLPGVPVATPSPIMNNLVRRLLLSRVEVPEGPSSVQSLLALRVERLMSAGRPIDVVQLIGRSAAASDNPAVARARTDALILSGDLPAACAAAEIMVRDSDDPYWLKAATLCRAKAGDIAGAALAVELFHEQGEADPDFVSLSAALLGGNTDVQAKISQLNALRFGMLRALEIGVSPEQEASAPPAILQALAIDQTLDLDRRLALANRAGRIGALTGDELGRIYGGVAFAPDDVPQAIDRAKTEPGPRSSALLFQLAVGGQDKDQRLQALQTLWRVADKAGTHQIVAAASSKLSKDLEPQAELSWFAADAVRALLAAGDLVQAMSWYEVLSDEAQIRMWPLLAAADANGVVPLPADAAYLWLKTLADLTDDQKRGHAARVFTLIEALGRPVSGDLWQEALRDHTESAEFPGLALLPLLDRAQAQGRLGEAIIYSLKALAPAGPAKSHPMVLAPVIRALTGAGLDEDARRVAVEALLGTGL